MTLTGVGWPSARPVLTTTFHHCVTRALIGGLGGFYTFTPPPAWGALLPRPLHTPHTDGIYRFVPPQALALLVRRGSAGYSRPSCGVCPSGWVSGLPTLSKHFELIPAYGESTTVI